MHICYEHVRAAFFYPLYVPGYNHNFDDIFWFLYKSCKSPYTKKLFVTHTLTSTRRPKLPRTHFCVMFKYFVVVLLISIESNALKPLKTVTATFLKMFWIYYHNVMCFKLVPIKKKFATPTLKPHKTETPTLLKNLKIFLIVCLAHLFLYSKTTVPTPSFYLKNEQKNFFCRSIEI